MNVFLVLLIPFVGTVLGSAAVFFMRSSLNPLVQKFLLGFASGVMVAASVWSLIIPSIEQCSEFGKFAFVPSAVGILLGMIFLFVLDSIIPHLHLDSEKPDGPVSKLKKTTMLVLAVTLHNIPEGMAVGIVLAAFLKGQNISGVEIISAADVFALSLGIAIQNFLEGAIISLPLKSEGNGKVKAFLYGSLSGIVEPIAGFFTILLASTVQNVMPYLLSFASGAMLFVVVEELVPEASFGEHSNMGTAGFAIGFVLMMSLDVALG